MPSFRSLTSARVAVWIFVAAIFLVYALLPFVVNLLLLPNPYFLELAGLTAVSCVCIVVGYCIPLFDHRFDRGALRLAIDADMLHVGIWCAFGAFLVVTFATAEAIPIISAIRGADTAELSQQRGDFLKARSGAEVALLYLSTLFVSALLPYSLAKLFMDRSRFRFVLAAVFLGFSISFLAKALFVNVMLPLLYVFAHQKRANGTRLLMVLGGSGALLYVVTVLAFGGQSEFESTGLAAAGDFFGAGYLPTGAVDHLIWRALAVPMFTASDTLLVFAERFDGTLLWGATSSFFAAIFGQERIPMEKLVFEQQWSWNDIASSNAVYITEAYVNFGWAGVALFSLFVGQSLRWFRKSRDEAFKALWMIYCLAIFTSSLIGTMLSNGYVLMFAIALFVQTGTTPRRPRASARAADNPPHHTSPIPSSEL